MVVELSLFILGATFLCELLDASLGMGYGTILTPLLVLWGCDIKEVVPATLISQAIASTLASIQHSRLKVVTFDFKCKESKIAIIMGITGIAAAVFAAFISLSIPKIALRTYVGILVAIIGCFLILGIRYKFSWKKMIGIGLISAFNKSLSGGGYGPVVASGQIVCGQEAKKAIPTTLIAEVPVCLAAFLIYCAIGKVSNFSLTYQAIVAAAIASLLGPYITKHTDDKRIYKIVGVFTLCLGAYLLIDTWVR